MKLLRNYLIIALGLFLTACEDVIDVDLDTVASRLVIDASIDWEKGTKGNEQKIKLSTTTAYYDIEFPAVSGAAIVVSNSKNRDFKFVEKPGSGEYICTDFEPVIGETYALKVTVNGEVYTATETLTATPYIENTIEQNNEGGMAGDEIEITFHHQDDANQENYYLYGIRTNRVAFPQYFVEDDENSQGNLTPVYYSHEDLEVGDNVNIQLYAISRRYYDYFRKLLSASGNDDSPFPTTPNEVRGNIINQTNSKNFAYGYFRLLQVNTRDYTIQ